MPAAAVAGLLAHDEDLSLPGAFPAGQQAARLSNLDQGTASRPSPLFAAAGLVRVPLHAWGLLNPGLRAMGIGFARDGFRDTAAFDVVPGADWPAGPAAVVRWPSPNSRNVPGLEGWETPEPRQALSPPVAALSPTGGQPVPTTQLQAGATLTATGGSRQLSSPVLFPRDPLQPDTWYDVDFSVTCGGQRFHRQWRFRTQTRSAWWS